MGLREGSDKGELRRPEYDIKAVPWMRVGEERQKRSSNWCETSADSVMTCSMVVWGVASAPGKGGEDRFKGGALEGSCLCKVVVTS